MQLVLNKKDIETKKLIWKTEFENGWRNYQFVLGEYEDKRRFFWILFSISITFFGIMLNAALFVSKEISWIFYLIILLLGCIIVLGYTKYRKLKKPKKEQFVNSFAFLSLLKRINEVWWATPKISEISQAGIMELQSFSIDTEGRRNEVAAVLRKRRDHLISKSGNLIDQLKNGGLNGGKVKASVFNETRGYLTHGTEIVSYSFVQDQSGSIFAVADSDLLWKRIYEGLVSVEGYIVNSREYKGKISIKGKGDKFLKITKAKIIEPFIDDFTEDELRQIF